MPALVAAGMTLTLGLLENGAGSVRQQIVQSVSETGAYPIFVSVVLFMLVFRINLSHTRYWEGRTHVQGMTANYACALSHACAFLVESPGRPARTRIAPGSGHKPGLFEDLQHLFSLLHGLSIQELRLDPNLDSLVPFVPVYADDRIISSAKPVDDVAAAQNSNPPEFATSERLRSARQEPDSCCDYGVCVCVCTRARGALMHKNACGWLRLRVQGM